jgi:hypothetical protein
VGDGGAKQREELRLNPTFASAMASFEGGMTVNLDDKQSNVTSSVGKQLLRNDNSPCQCSSSAVIDWRWICVR